MELRTFLFSFLVLLILNIHYSMVSGTQLDLEGLKKWTSEFRCRRLYKMNSDFPSQWLKGNINGRNEYLISSRVWLGEERRERRGTDFQFQSEPNLESQTDFKESTKKWGNIVNHRPQSGSVGVLELIILNSSDLLRSV